MRLWGRKPKDDYLGYPPPPEEPKRMTYCIVPEDLASKLYDSLSRHYAKDPNIEVIIERRKADRRVNEEQRKKDIGPPAGMKDRRRIRNEDGRRVGERRAQLIPVEPPDDVPRKARKYLAHPSEEELEEARKKEEKKKEDGPFGLERESLYWDPDYDPNEELDDEDEDEDGDEKL